MIAVLRKSFLGLLGLCLAGSAFAQGNATFKVAGPCLPCGTDRILGIIKGLDGVSGASYSASTSLLTVQFDPAAASVIDMQLELSINGYDAGDFTHDSNAKLPECARGGMRGDQAVDDLGEPGIDDIEGLEGDTDWEDPDAFELVGTSGDDYIDILDDEVEVEDDLSSFADESLGDEFGEVVEEDEDDSDE